MFYVHFVQRTVVHILCVQVIHIAGMILPTLQLKENKQETQRAVNKHTYNYKTE